MTAIFIHIWISKAQLSHLFIITPADDEDQRSPMIMSMATFPNFHGRNEES